MNSLQLMYMSLWLGSAEVKRFTFPSNKAPERRTTWKQMIWKNTKELYGFPQVLLFCDTDIMQEITFFTKMAAFNIPSKDMHITRNTQEHCN